MKCIALVVMLALAAVNASVLPIGYPYAAYPYAAYAGVSPYSPGISLTQGLSGISTYGYGVPTVVAAHSAVAPAVVAAPAPHQAYVAAPAVVAAPAASYVASTRGAQHVAPLVGHIQSVASTNVQPAPGTL